MMSESHYNMTETEFKQVDETHIISGEFDRCIGLGDLWPVAVAGRDRGLLDTVLLDGCRNPGLGAGAS